jgi:hypothetical protein
MNGCPDCEARLKEVEERKRRDDRSGDYLTGVIAGGVAISIMSTMLFDGRLGGIAMMIGCCLGALWVFCRGEKFGTGR